MAWKNTSSTPQPHHPTEKEVRELGVAQNQEVNDEEAGGTEEQSTRQEAVKASNIISQP